MKSCFQTTRHAAASLSQGFIAPNTSLQPSALRLRSGSPTFSLQPFHAPARPTPAPRAGFTLLEMLVVVIIIAVLASMVLGLMKIVGNWTAKSQTNERLGKVRAAIEEFYAEYGKYPPVWSYSGYRDPQPFCYEYAWSNGMNSVVFNYVTDPAHSNTPPIFTFGLMSFLVRRYGDEWGRGGIYHASNMQNFPGGGGNMIFGIHQWVDYNFDSSGNDQSRDISAIQRWKTYIQDIQSVAPGPPHLLPGYAASVGTYTNILDTVYDGWGNELHYASPPPNQAYRLWSDGPRTDTTADDISTGPGW